MKRYRLLKDLPTFDAGDVFFINRVGNLVRERDEVVAYLATTLKKFPNILEEWFAPEGYYYIHDDGSSSDLEKGVGYSPLDNSSVAQRRKAIGNHFETEEEAEKAVRKLEAWKRLKDIGCRFILDDNLAVKFVGPEVTKIVSAEEGSMLCDDYRLLFGGEE